MSRKFLEISIGFDEAEATRIAEACTARHINRAALIRVAVAEYLDRQIASAESAKRIAMMSEFTQAAVDVLLSEQAPDRRDDILLTVQKRMERYHA